ncbi:MAG: hypothetical protein PUJ00_08060 [Actinobacillus minor]|nr:ACT domain-containing protein [Actinobacillus minor]MDD6911114.1 hypothetical protein [Actinobacillus minor]
MANEKVNVLSVSSRTDMKRGLAIINMEIQLTNVDMLNKILSRVAQLEDVIEAKRAN